MISRMQKFLSVFLSEFAIWALCCLRSGVNFISILGAIQNAEFCIEQEIDLFLQMSQKSQFSFTILSKEEFDFFFHENQ